jgi:hypothetical protein
VIADTGGYTPPCQPNETERRSPIAGSAREFGSVARHVRRQHDHLAFAAPPLLLAAHQLDEALVTSATASTCTPGSSS